MGYAVASVILGLLASVSQVHCQGAGGYDFNAQSQGEHSGQLSPLQVAGVSMVVVACLGATAVAAFFCYYVYRKKNDVITMPRY
ncbi:uncharacterized protein LOC135388345 [Ornithodoros turicata]|uniref:uncharacterized protein LOC135388345 n=1 Tax=Ornithodoros turicata TaxID=34597 RepID=UPI003139F944